MAFPEDRLSTSLVQGNVLPPEAPFAQSNQAFELGPTTLEDTSDGLQFQVWELQIMPNSDFRLRSADNQEYILDNHPTAKFVDFTFDQNGRVAYSFTDDTSSYLYWFDTAISDFVLTDLGAGKITPRISLDDKRFFQFANNDMLLWYTEFQAGSGDYNLYMRRQRDRFQTTFLLAEGFDEYYIEAVGMNDRLRLQISLSAGRPI